MKSIQFNKQMTAAILRGRKRRTMRPIKKIMPIHINSTYYEINNFLRDGQDFAKYAPSDLIFDRWSDDDYPIFYSPEKDAYFAGEPPKFSVGDDVLVREPARVIEYNEGKNYGGTWCDESAKVKYLADDLVVFWDDFPDNPKDWLYNCGGIPNGCCRSLARIFLKITDVQVIRISDLCDIGISEDGIRCPIPNMWSERRRKEYKKKEFIKLWNSVSAAGYEYGDDPFVYAYRFDINNDYEEEVT